MCADNLSGWLAMDLSELSILLRDSETERQCIDQKGLGRHNQALVHQGQGLILPRPRPLNLAKA